MTNIAQRVHAIVAEELCVDHAAVTPDAELITDLGADSLDLITLPFELEQAFDLDIIAEDDAEAFRTVGDIIAYLERRLGAAVAA